MTDSKLWEWALDQREGKKSGSGSEYQEEHRVHLQAHWLRDVGKPHLQLRGLQRKQGPHGTFQFELEQGDEGSIQRRDQSCVCLCYWKKMNSRAHNGKVSGVGG